MATEKQTLKVLPSGTAMVANIEALGASARRYVGRQFDPTLGEERLDGLKAGGWVPKTEPEEIPYRREYVQAVKEGDLIAADEATAKLCRVPFQPTDKKRTQLHTKE